jgi:hypothetical protein
MEKLPHLIFNTDGNWMLFYLPDRNPEDITYQLDTLVPAGVDGLAALIGIDDDIVWRGSPHAAMWGDDTEVWDPDPDVDADGNPIRKKTAGGFELSRLENLYNCMDTVIGDGRDLMEVYIEGCRKHNIAAIASMRMNDAHTSDEAREWQVRSELKKSRPDLLIGSPTPTRAGHADRWNFCWQWNYEHEEVRARFLGLVDEILERYDFDGVELDWMRGPPYFRTGRLLDNLDTLTGFMREAHGIVRRHSETKGKKISLISRVPPSLSEARLIGIDAPTWIREPVADLFVLSSASYCPAHFDIAEAVEYANDSGVPIYIGFDGATHLTSPHEGYTSGVPAVLRGVTLNAYKQGASGVYIFNYDYRHHRASPCEEENYNDDHLSLLTDLSDPCRLACRDRSYSVMDAALGGNVYHSAGDPHAQVPRELSMPRRATGGPGYEMNILIEDDMESGLADGRIVGTQLRLRLTDHEKCMDRIFCKINDQTVSLDGASTIEGSQGATWLVIDNPPIQCGENQVLIGLEGLPTPDPWPTLHQCEVMVLGRDSAS